MDYHLENECEVKMINCQYCKKKYHINLRVQHENDLECLKIQSQLLKSVSQDINRKTFDIILLGNAAVGKSSFLKWYILGNFNFEVMTTLSTERVKREIAVKNGEIVNVYFWDTAGDEKYKSVT